MKILGIKETRNILKKKKPLTAYTLAMAKSRRTAKKVTKSRRSRRSAPAVKRRTWKNRGGGARGRRKSNAPTKRSGRKLTEMQKRMAIVRRGKLRRGTGLTKRRLYSNAAIKRSNATVYPSSFRDLYRVQYK